MKQYLCILLCLAMALSLIACAAETPSLTDPETKETTPETQIKTKPASSAPSSSAPASSVSQGSDENGGFEDLTPPQSEEAPATPRFDSGYGLEVYASSFAKDQKKIHKGEGGRLYVETTDGALYSVFDEERNNNLLDVENLKSWSISEHIGFLYLDTEGYYHMEDHIAYDVKGEILYAFVSGNKLCVYSIDDEGCVYCNTFDRTGKKEKDNVKLSFDEKEQNGYNFTHLGLYDRISEVRLLSSKNSYSPSPYVFFTLNGKTYVEQIFNVVIADKISVITNNALSEEERQNLLDYDPSAYSTVYTKEGVNDKLFYTYKNDEYELFLPDGHTTEEMTYFNRGKTDLMIFDNGDVYHWSGEASILGEKPEKAEAISQIGGEIQEVLYLNSGSYCLLMSDGILYQIDN